MIVGTVRGGRGVGLHIIENLRSNTRKIKMAMAAYVIILSIRGKMFLRTGPYQHVLLQVFWSSKYTYENEKNNITCITKLS